MQLRSQWLPNYAKSTRCVWENILDPILFATETGCDAASLNDQQCGSIVQHIQRR